ncbi:MAG TPA: DUF4349 domain-containing protein [Bacteroidales bacterium]|nr:DUF4349 domain-containing protein [Bacteroidales bacterium]
MKKTFFYSVALLCLLAACNMGPSSEEKSSREKSKQDSVVSAMDEGYASAVPAEESEAKADEEGQLAKQEKKAEPVWDSAFIKLNSSRKLIKTANLNFKVKNVEDATQQIERITKRFGGFILSSSIKNNVYSYDEYRVGRDSMMVVGVNKIENNITLRVPEFVLDSALFYIGKIWVKLDERTINAQDVTIQILANELRAQLYQKTATKINSAADNNQKKLNDVVNAEETAANYLENTINKKIENLELQDKIDFSTVTLFIYQDKILYREMIANVDTEQYAQSFGGGLVDSLTFGWKIFKAFLLFLVKCWSLILISVLIFLAVWFTIKFFVNRGKRKRERLEKK